MSKAEEIFLILQWIYKQSVESKSPLRNRRHASTSLPPPTCHVYAVQAKKMVYEIRQAPTSGNKGKRKRELKEDINMASHSNEAVEVVPSLEPLPKRALVQNILEVSAEATFLEP